MLLLLLLLRRCCRIRSVFESKSALILEALDIFEPKHWTRHRAGHNKAARWWSVPLAGASKAEAERPTPRSTTVRPHRRGDGSRSQAHTPARAEGTKHDTKWNIVMKRQKENENTKNKKGKNEKWENR